MTQDPYQPPQAPSAPQTPQPLPGHYGRIDIGRAFGDGWERMKRNVFTWLGVTLVAGILSGVSFAALLIPALIVVPAIGWGYSSWLLDAYEDRGTFGQVFDGFSNLGAALAGFLVLILFYVLVGIPGQAFSLAGEEAELPILSLVGSLISFVVSIITMRWAFAGFFVVEHRLNGIDAIRASWRATQGQWVTVVLLSILGGVAMLAGMLLLVVGIIPAGAVVSFAYVSAYRQLVGPRASA